MTKQMLQCAVILEKVHNNSAKLEILKKYVELSLLLY